MIRIAFALGVYPLIIFFLGIFNLLYPPFIIGVTVVFWLWFIVSQRNIFVFSKFIAGGKDLLSSKLSLLFSFLLVVFFLVSGVGVLTPELGFDALWYHLTLPKLYLLNHSIYHIPGQLLYYSAMPKLGEMYYILALTLGDERVAKLIHYLFGVGCVVLLIRFARNYLSLSYSLLVGLVFYSNLLVLWESSSAYIDLIWTFFELATLICFIEGVKTGKQKWYYMSSFMMGFALSCKLLALRSVAIYLFLQVKELYLTKNGNVKNIVLFIQGVFLISLSQFLFAYIHTGNPIYPLFSSHFSSLSAQVFSLETLTPLRFLKTFWITFTQAADPLSPVYLISFPLILFYYRNMTRELQLICQYCLLGYMGWYITALIEGPRLFLPYLPALSLLSVYVLHQLIEISKDVRVTRIVFGVILGSICLSLLYRTGALSSSIPVILGNETKEQYLSRKLTFTFGDFYDVDGYFSHSIKPTDTVLLYGFHNMYYVNFPYIHITWAKKGDTFTHIATQHTDLPAQFADGKLIYHNAITGVSLYTRSTPWSY